MLYEVCGSNAEICVCFSDLNGIGLNLNKIVEAKIIVHAFIFIYLSTVTDWHRYGLEHYARGKRLDRYIRYNSYKHLLIRAVTDCAIVD